jgi:hypothetical protein
MMMSTQRASTLVLSRSSHASCCRRNTLSRATPRRFLSDKPQQPAPSRPVDPKYAKTTAGTGRMPGSTPAEELSRNRGPVSWAALGLVAVASASAVGYYQVERERRLERAMGKVVSSTYRDGGEDEGWSPNPEFLARRKWKLTKYGWFPEEDAFGGGELYLLSTCCRDPSQERERG